MKKLIFVIILILLAAILCAQELATDTVNYRAHVVSEHTDRYTAGHTSNALFMFRENVIMTTLGGQRRAFYIIGDWRLSISGKGTDIRVAQGVDDGGFKLIIHLAYDEASGRHVIILEYNNVDFIFEVSTEETERPYDELFLYASETPDYTPERIDNFLRQFGNPEAIKIAMMKELLMD